MTVVPHAPASWFLPVQRHHANGVDEENVDDADADATAQSQQSLLLLRRVIAELESATSPFSSSSDGDDDDGVRLWLHCASHAEAAMAADALARVAVTCGPSLGATSASAPPRRARGTVGLCLPCPATRACAQVYFRADSTDAPRAALRRLMDDACAPRGVPTSVWLLSALSCPVGGGSGIDVVEVADIATELLADAGCAEVFFDDTAGTVTARHLENSIKTLAAVASSSSGADLRRVALSIRTNRVKSADDPTTKPLSARESAANAVDDERVSRAVAKAQSIGFVNLCGTSIVDVSAASAAQPRHDPQHLLTTLRSPLHAAQQRWPSLLQQHGWLANSASQGFEVGAEESSLEAQARLEALESAYERESAPLRRVERTVRSWARQRPWVGQKQAPL